MIPLSRVDGARSYGLLVRGLLLAGSVIAGWLLLSSPAGAEEVVSAPEVPSVAGPAATGEWVHPDLVIPDYVVEPVSAWVHHDLAIPEYVPQDPTPVVGLAVAPVTAAAVVPPIVDQCNGVDNAGGQAQECDITVTNTVDLGTGAKQSSVTVRECHGAAGAALPCTTSTTPFPTLTTNVNQCNGSGNGGGGRVTCNVTLVNNITGVATTTPATVNQCNGSGEGGGIVPTTLCTPVGNTLNATVDQCNGSGNGGGLTMRVRCTVEPSTQTSALPVTINQCNGSGNGGGAIVICTTSVRNNVFAAGGPVLPLPVTPTPTPTPGAPAPTPTPPPPAGPTPTPTPTPGATPPTAPIAPTPGSPTPGAPTPGAPSAPAGPTAPGPRTPGRVGPGGGPLVPLGTAGPLGQETPGGSGLTADGARTAGSSSGSSGGATSGLPRTGLSVGMVPVGLALLLFGALAMLVGRRRTSRV